MYFGRWFGTSWTGEWYGDDDAPDAAGGYFGHRYFGARYFGPRYFSPQAEAVPPGDGPAGYFGHRYFGVQYYGYRYFAPYAEVTPPVAGVGGYFGHRYFGATFYGPRYFSPAYDIDITAPPVEVGTDGASAPRRMLDSGAASRRRQILQEDEAILVALAAWTHMRHK